MRAATANRRRGRHLVLVGAGHSHLRVLRSLAQNDWPDVQVTLVSPSSEVLYSGMVPGVLAGRHARSEAVIDAAALAARAEIAFVRDRVSSLDPDRRTLVTAGCGEIPWDILSLDPGAAPRDPGGWLRHEHVVAVRPIDLLERRLAAFVEGASSTRISPTVAVVGGGAAGVEIAFALAERLRGLHGARVVLAERGSTILSGRSLRARTCVARELARCGVELVVGRGPIEVDVDGLSAGGERVAAPALVVLATGAGAPGFLATSGLATDREGFLLVDRFLRSIDRPEVYAAGDCARPIDHPNLDRSGVFAVRQGPVLATNLRAAAGSGRGLQPFRPQAAVLSLLGSGSGRAIALWRGWAGAGRPWLRLKDRIDRAFVSAHRPPRASSPRSPEDVPFAADGMRPCGGCAAKVDARSLRTLLAGARGALGAEDVLIGLEAPDDAAVLRVPGGGDLVVTIDAFPPFCGDLHAVGEIAAVHAASDVVAWGGRPTAALLLLSVARDAGAAREATLGLLLHGVRSGLDRLGVPLVGGHTSTGDDTLVGLTIVGRLGDGPAWTRGGARPGDRLVLTRALGTGVVLAASAAGECPAAWTDAALAAMREGNATCPPILARFGVRACTDVSGFGFLGHLAEMLAASKVGARVDLDALPALPGALELAAVGWRSTADLANRHALGDVLPHDAPWEDPRMVLACDPQTSGGLLVAVPAEATAGLLDDLRAAGIAAHLVGEVLATPGDRAIALSTFPNSGRDLTPSAPGL